MAARLSLTPSSSEEDHDAAVAARMQPHGPERGTPGALFGSNEGGMVKTLLVSPDMASKDEDAPSIHALVQAPGQLNGRAALSMNVTKTQPQGQRLQTLVSERGDKGISPDVQDTSAIERGSTHCLMMPGAKSTCHLNTSPQTWIDGPALATAVLSFRLHIVLTVCAIMQGAGCIVMVQDVLDSFSLYSYLLVATSAPWASLDLLHPMPVGNEQASRERNGQAALSMNVAETQPRGQRLQMPTSGRVIISPGVRGKNVIDHCSTESLTVSCQSLWAEPSAAITRHSSAPPSQAAWMDGPALAAVAALNFGLYLVWSFYAIVRGMMHAVLVINRLWPEPSAPCAFSGVWLMQPCVGFLRAMHRNTPCTPKSARAVLLPGERPPSSMGGLAPHGWHCITENMHGVACIIQHRIATTARASQRECLLAPEHPERKRRSSSCGPADLHLGVWLLCPNYDHWTRPAARFRMVLPIADALWRIMVLSSFRLAVHGSIVAVICACLSMGLFYAMPQHHRMDHKSLVVCLCCFAHHHVCSTFAMLDEKWARGFALDAVPRPVHRIMHCWRYHSTLAGAGGATAATYQSLSLDATTKDGTRKPSACGSATLLATVLAVTNVVARFCSTLSEHVIHVFNNVWLATVSTMRQGRRKHCTGPSSPMGLVKMLLVVILCFAQNVHAGHAMIDGKNTEDFAREFSESFDSICQRDDAPGSSISQLIYRACDVMVSKQHDLPMGQEDMFDLRCTRIDSLLHDLWEVANEANVKEGLEFVREVEVLVEKETVCRTPTSSCLANKFRDSRVDAFLLGKTMQECSAGHVEAREGSCEDFQQLRERMDQVVHEYASEKGLVEQIRESAGRLLERAECKAPATHGRKLSSSLPICSFQSASEGFYRLTESCRLTDQITVGSGKTLTIVGIGDPIIDREQNGRHFYVSGGGHLNVTGVTLANGRVTNDNVSWML